MKRILLALAAAAALWPQASGQGVVTLPAPEKTDSTRAEIDAIFADLEKISGLKASQPVDFNRLQRGELGSFLDQRIKEIVKPEEIREEEAALKKFGFAPPDFDLRKTMIELLSEQAAAFYDYRKHKLFMIGPAEDLMQHTALVHELAHALADQNFKLEEYMEKVKKNDDAQLARLAVMEGQATWLMAEYLARRTGNSLEDSPFMLKMLSSPTALMSGGNFPVFQKAPLYIRETLLFPYTQGLLFQHAVFERMGQGAFAELFRNPPVSTQQVLHPDKYAAGMKPVHPELPPIPGQGAYRCFTSGEIGELDHAILLKQYATEEVAKSLAPEWRGGAFEIVEDNKDGRQVLAYASEWSSAAAARQFFDQYRAVLKKKWKTFRASQCDGAVSGHGDDGYFALRLDGARVTSVEGLPAPADRAEKSAAAALH